MESRFLGKINHFEHSPTHSGTSPRCSGYIPSGTGYIPRHDADFEIWFKNIKEYVAMKTGSPDHEWEYIPNSAVTELNEAYKN